MKTRILIYCWSALAILFALHSCTEDESRSTTLDLSTPDILLYIEGLNDAGQTATFNITSTATWNAVCATWITLGTTAGAIGTATVTVAAGFTDEDRTGYITIRSGNQQRVITVKQVAREAVPTTLTVMPSEITVNYRGRLDNDAVPSIVISSNKDWTIAGLPEWIEVENLTGTAGANINIPLNIDMNASDAERMAIFTVNAGIVSQSITITQQPVTRQVYFEDDFSWVEHGSDDVGQQIVGDARNMYTWAPPGGAAGDLLTLFNSKGYTDINPARQTIYFMAGYFKLGMTNKQTGIQRTLTELPTGASVDVSVLFDACPYASAAKNYDQVLLRVVIEGSGSVGVDDNVTKDSGDLDIRITNGDNRVWKPQHVVLYGVTSETKITIRTNKGADNGGTDTGVFRWYIDNLRLVEYIEF
ncbi:MAG: BACON domain-containing protein [Prevotellaceae bacterium]|jgi:hypothetical protein|nr:BACON domain-containing protein [Prevotellaceae bacterium]